MRALIAGFGNVFFHDDGFGPEVLAQSATHRFPDDVRLRDFGISGMHLALEMLEPYELVVLVDAVRCAGPPGTLFVIEPDSYERPVVPDGHAMDAGSVLALYEHLCRDMEPLPQRKILVAGCVPQDTGEGMGLSPAVAAAVPRCIETLERLVEPLPTGAPS